MITKRANNIKAEVLDLDKLDQAYTCIIHLLGDQPQVLRQVTLDPTKVKNALIRLGENPGDEAQGWQYPESIEVLDILGTVEVKVDKTLTVTPIPSRQVCLDETEIVQT